ncbi:MAG: hypothetical protein AAGA90_04795 [Actinomycetota bacterium]
MVGTGAVVGAGAWVAPSILSYDRVAAAIGSCGTKPLQVDWTNWAGLTIPGSVTALDGTTVTITVSDPDNVQDSTWNFRAFNGVINGRDNPAITGMENANNSAGVTITLTFSTPVQPSFFLVDVDRADDAWEDRVRVRGFLGGGGAIDPDSLTVGGGAVQVINPRLVEGVFSSNSSNSEVEVDFQELVDTVEIRHFDHTTWTNFQWIGVHDLHWC